MFHAQLDSILPIPTDELIQKFEKYYRIKFPEGYIGFLKQYNGAVPENGEFSFANHEYYVERFLCLLENDIRDEMEDVSWSEIRVTITELDERLIDDEDLVGMNIIPVAVLFAGDYVCLDYRDNTIEPSVCIWHHEESEEFAPATEKVANDFNSFLEMFAN